MKIFLSLLFLLVGNPLDADETVIVYSSATVTIPDRYVVIKKETGDCPGIAVTVRPEGSDQEFGIGIGSLDAALSLHPTQEDLKRMEFFERDPKSWFGYHCVVFWRVDSRLVQVRYPIENVIIGAKIAKDADFRKVIADMKKIGVHLTKGWRLEASEEDLSFRTFAPK